MNKKAVLEQIIFSAISFLIFTVSAKFLEDDQLYWMVTFSIAYGFAANIQSAIVLDPISIDRQTKMIAVSRQVNTILALLISICSGCVLYKMNSSFSILASLGMFFALISALERRLLLISERYTLSSIISACSLVLSFFGLYVVIEANSFDDPLLPLLLSYAPLSLYYFLNMSFKWELSLWNFRDGLSLIPSSILGAISSQIMTLGGVFIGRDVANETRVLTYFFNPIMQAANAFNIRMLSGLIANRESQKNSKSVGLFLAVGILTFSAIAIAYAFYANFNYIYLVIFIALDTAAAISINLIGARLKFRKQFKILLQYNMYQVALFLLGYIFMKDSFMAFIAFSRILVALLQANHYRRMEWS